MSVREQRYLRPRIRLVGNSELARAFENKPLRDYALRSFCKPGWVIPLSVRDLTEQCIELVNKTLFIKKSVLYL